MSTLRTSTILATMALAAASCTSGTDPTTTTTTIATTTTTRPTTTTTTTMPTTTTTVPEVFGGEVVVGLPMEPDTLNPLLSDEESVLLVTQAWTTGVYDISGETGELIPEVVVELPTVANGGVVVNGDGTMTVTYQIRQDARWSDGTPITGSDFQFTLDTILDPTLSIDRDVYTDIISSTVGEKTFGFTLAFPTIEFERLFGVLIPRHQVAGTDFATDWNDTAWMSGGPFVFERWIPTQAITFTRNDEYWKTDPETNAALPYLDAVTFRIVDDDVQRFEAAAGGALHAVMADEALVEQLGTLTALGAATDTEAGPVWVHLNFQFGEGRWDRNPDSLNEYLSFRQAIMHAIDTERIATELFGNRAIPLDSYVEAYSPALNGAAWARYPYDPDLAVGLLAEAVAQHRTAVEGATSDVVVFFTTNADNDDRVRLSELVGEMLTEVGVAYLDTSEDSITFFGETVGSGRYDMSAWAWQADAGRAALVAFHDTLDPGDERVITNFYRYGTDASSVRNQVSQRFERILDEMRDTVDHRELAELVAEAEQLIAERALILPLYAEPVTAIYWPEMIDGFELSVASGFTWNIEHWKVPQE